MMKRAIATLLVLMMVLGMLPNAYVGLTVDAATVTASGYCGGEGDGTNLKWTLTSDGVLTISGAGKMANYTNSTMPWKSYKSSVKTLVLEEGMTTIGSSAFRGLSNTKHTLDIPESVTEIGSYAFYQSAFTGDLVIPNKVTKVGSYAFYWCSGFSGTLTLGEKIKELGSYCFYLCAFSGELILPDTLETIDDTAFFGGKYTGSVEIPAATENIGWNPFSGCGSITGFTVAEESEYFRIINGIVYNYDKTELMFASNSVEGELAIPESVTRINGYALRNCEDLTGTLKLPDGIRVIEDGAFYGCTGFTGDLILPNSVGGVGSYAFCGCTGLDGELVLSNNMTYVHSYAFYNNPNLTGPLIIPDTLTSIQWYAFYKLGTEGVYFYGNAPYFNGSSQFDADETLYYIPETTGWTESSYYDAEAGTWNGWPLQVWEPVAECIHKETEWTTAFVGNNTHTTTCICTSCGKVLEEPVKETCTDADYDMSCDICSGLTNVTSGYCGGEGDSTNLIWTLRSDGSLTISGTGAMVNYEKGKAPWYGKRDSITSIVLEDGISYLGAYAFYGCNQVTGAPEIPNTVTVIGEYAFYECTGISGVVEIPESVTSIENCAFYGCNKVTGVHFLGDAPIIYVASDSNRAFDPGKIFYYEKNTTGWTDCRAYDVESGMWNEHHLRLWNGSDEGILAFGYCGGESGGLNLTWTLIEDGTLTISGKGAMRSYAHLFVISPWHWYRGVTNTLVLEEGITSIGNSAFNSDYFKGTIKIPDSVTSIGIQAFWGCDGVDEIFYIPKTVTSIGYGMLGMSEAVTAVVVDEENPNYCSIDGIIYTKDLTQVVGAPAGYQGELNIPKTVTSIFPYSFVCCTGVEGELKLPDGLREIGEHAFIGCTGLIGSLTIPNGVTEIPDYAFCRCSGFDGTLTMGEGVTKIGEKAFYGCNFTGTLIIPDGVTNIGDSAFEGCGRFEGDVTLPEGLVHIGKNPFKGCHKIQGIHVRDKNEHHHSKDGIVYDKNGNRLHFAPGGHPGHDKKPKKGNDGRSAFSLMSTNEETGLLVIPAEVAYVDANALDSCENISEIYFEGNAPTVLSVISEERSFGKEMTLYYVPGTTGWIDSDAYDASAETWNGYALAEWTGEMETEIETFDISGINMTLGNELELNIMLPKATVDAYGEDLTVTVIHHEYVDGDTAYTFNMADLPLYGGGKYYKASIRVAAAQMTDLVDVIVTDEDGNVYSNEFTTSVLTYVTNNLDKQTAKVKTLLVDMVNYGAAAQDNFTYRQDLYANSNLTDEHKALATPAVECTDIRVSGTNYVGSNLSLQDCILLNFMFTGVSDDVRETMYATVSFTGVLGNEVNVTVPVEKLMTRYAGVAVNQIVLADAVTPVTVTLYNADGSVYGYATDSVESYNARQNPNGTNALYTNIMKFAASALAYKQN